MAMRRWSCLVVLVACGGGEKAPPPAPAPAPEPAPVTVDAGITAIGTNDPDRFTDPDPDRVVGQPVRTTRKIPRRPIDVMLKSTPSGAMAAVDGVQIGHTPAYWYGEADGHDHEFTFVLAGHAVGRYRFVPIQSGTVHARLEPVSEESPHDAGVDPVTQPVTPQPFTPANPEPPGPIEVPEPPATVTAPVDAASAEPVSPDAPAAPPTSPIGPVP